MAPTKTSKTASPASAQGRTSLDDAATFIGSSLGELMNRKDALAKQMAAVEKQIAAARDRLKAGVSSTVAAARKAMPTPAKKTKTAAKATAPAGRKGNRKKKRPLPPDDPMVQATTRNATAQVKARTARTMRTTRRSGNR